MPGPQGRTLIASIPKGAPMSGDNIAGLVLAVLLAAYLVAALVIPEKL